MILEIGKCPILGILKLSLSRICWRWNIPIIYLGDIQLGHWPSSVVTPVRLGSTYQSMSRYWTPISPTSSNRFNNIRYRSTYHKTSDIAKFGCICHMPWWQIRYSTKNDTFPPKTPEVLHGTLMRHEYPVETIWCYTHVWGPCEIPEVTATFETFVCCICHFCQVWAFSLGQNKYNNLNLVEKTSQSSARAL